MADVERRDVRAWVTTDDGSGTEVRAEGEADGLVVRGYAAIFNSDSERMGRVIEQIDPRAFDNVLADDELDVRLLAEHEGLALARTTNGTLALGTDERGLWFRANLNPDTRAGRDLHALIERGDVTQMSFGFSMRPPVVESRDEDTGITRVRVKEVTRLYELSAVTFPAYADSSVGVLRKTGGARIGDSPVTDPVVERLGMELDLAHGGVQNGSPESTADGA